MKSIECLLSLVKDSFLGIPFYRFYYPGDVEKVAYELEKQQWRRNDFNWIWAGINERGTGRNIHEEPVFADLFATSWGEVNADVSTKIKVSENAQTLIGINYFNYQNPIDNDDDQFTDLTLQHRISIFNKWNFKRKENRLQNN